MKKNADLSRVVRHAAAMSQVLPYETLDGGQSVIRGLFMNAVLLARPLPVSFVFIDDTS